jgi:transcriptional regulator with XRE-family HTH domain
MVILSLSSDFSITIIMDMKTIGSRIKEHRKLKGFTQAQLAEKLGITVGSVSQWEQGVTEPSISNMKALCTHLETPLEWLAFGTGVSGLEEYLVDITKLYEGDPRLIYLSDSQKDFIEAFSRLPKVWQAKVIEEVQIVEKHFTALKQEEEPLTEG